MDANEPTGPELPPASKAPVTHCEGDIYIYQEGAPGDGIGRPCKHPHLLRRLPKPPDDKPPTSR